MKEIDDIEKPVCRYAKTKGWHPIKLAIVMQKGFPDRTFLRKGKEIFFIEFKVPGKEPNGRQRFIHKMLKGFGFDVHVVTSVEIGKLIIDSYD